MKKVLPFVFVLTNFGLYAQQKMQEPKQNIETPETKCVNPILTSSHRHSGSKGRIYTYEYTLDGWNPNEDCFIKPRHLKDRVFIKINNINRLAYGVTVADSTFFLPLANISIFDTLVANLAKSASTPSVLPKLAMSDTPLTQKVTKKQGQSIEIYSLELIGDTIAVDPFFEQKNKIKQLQNSINNEYKKLFNLLNDIESFSKFAKNVPVIVANECCSMDNLQRKIETDANIQLLFTDIKYNAISNKANDVLLKVDLIKTSEMNIKNNQAAVKQLIAEIKKECKNLREVLYSFCDVDALEEGAYPKDLEEILAAAGKVDKQKISDALVGLQGILAQAANMQNFTFLSNASIPRGDELIIRTIIEPLNTTGSKLSKYAITHTLPVRGKFEWAIGPTLTFHLGKNLFDETFSIDTAKNFSAKGHQDSGKYSITKDAIRTKLVPSLGLMANFYWQNHSAVTPGIALGLATSAANLTDIKAYLGGSLLLGGISEKVLLNLGLAFGSVSRLKSNLNEGLNAKSQVPFTGDKVGAPTDLVEKVLRAGLFFGLSYKLN